MTWLLGCRYVAAASPAAFGACVDGYSLPGEYKRSEAVIRGFAAVVDSLIVSYGRIDFQHEVRNPKQT
jgi:hypothetical protein